MVVSTLVTVTLLGSTPAVLASAALACSAVTLPEMPKFDLMTATGVGVGEELGGGGLGMTVAHVKPRKPVAHVLVKPFTASAHWPPFLHGLLAQSLMSVAHVEPDNPAAQPHLNESVPASVHVPPFLHGALAQSSTSVRQVLPVQPDLHWQVNLLVPVSLQVPELRQGLGSQSSTSASQSSPVQPVTHLQLKESVPCVHLAPNLHGLEAHSLTSTAQVAPLQPALHAHLKDLVPVSLQTPLLRHVNFAAQSSASLSHVEPVHPLAQEHVGEAFLPRHLPPLAHVAHLAVALSAEEQRVPPYLAAVVTVNVDVCAEAVKLDQAPTQLTGHSFTLQLWLLAAPLADEHCWPPWAAARVIL